MASSKTQSFVNQMWDDVIIPELCEYIKVPNKFPMIDPGREKHGYRDAAIGMLEKWCRHSCLPWTGLGRLESQPHIHARRGMTL